MFLIACSKLKLFQPLEKTWDVFNLRRGHKKISKFRNEFAYKNDFKRIFEDIKQVKPNRIVSSDVVSRKKKNKFDISDHSRGSSYRSRKEISLEYRGELLFGLHPVYLALIRNKRTFHQLFISLKTDEVENVSSENASRKQEITNLAKSLSIDIRDVTSKELKYLVPDAVHQGVCLDASHIQLLEWKETESVTPDEFPVWLVLDEILDPMNVGAIIRSAYYFGVKKIFTVKGNSCRMSPTVSKASSGAMEIMDIYQIENLEYFIKVMMSQNWNIVSTRACNNNETDCEKLVNVLEFKFRQPTILVLGNEGRGVSPTIQALCNSFISIYPSHRLHEGIDSLNVSVAAGVILHCLFNSWKNRLK